jgi:tricorn protease
MNAFSLKSPIKSPLNYAAISVVVLTALASQTASAQAGYYRQPTIQGDTVVFVAEGDLWRVPVTGGAAQRLTTNLAEESLPRISADGKLLAFTARYEGPAEVYVMPTSGGLPTRLTHEGDNARVQGFTPDGKVLYTTARWSSKPELRMYAVDVTTRAVTPLPLAQAAEGCYLKSDFVFARLPAGSDNVKNYRGGLVQNLWRFDGKNEATPLTADYPGASRQPMCARDRIYFLSDRDGTMNVWSIAAAGGDIKQHTKHRDFDIRGASISPDGKRIVYQRGADLSVLDTAMDKDSVIPITLQSDFEHTRTRWVKTPWDFVTALEPSPTGDRVAITARGEIFVLPVGNGRRVELLRNANIRARDAVFSHDGKSVYAFSDKSGEFELTRYPANGVGAATTLTKDANTLRRGIYPSPDGKWVVHDDKTRNLFLTETATNTTRQIDRNQFSEYNTIIWSPDSRNITFSKPAANQFEQLYVLEIATTKLTTLSSERYDAGDATFSPDGKWLFFLANRNLQSVVTSPWGQRGPEPFFDKQTRIYAYALNPTVRWPFLPRDELQPPPKVDAKPEPKPDAKPAEAAKPDAPKASDKTENKTENKAETKPEVKALPIAWDGVRERLYEVPIAAGNYRELSTDGKRLFFLSLDTGDRKTALRSVAIEAPNPAPPSVDAFMEDVRSYRMTQDRKKLMVRKANDVFVFDVAKAAPPPAEQIKFQVNTRDWMIQLDPREEWKQMFVDVWRMHRDFFYDKNMHGADWATARARYQPLLARVTDRAELNDVIAQMTSEVRALHSQVNTPDIRRGQDTIDIGGLGARLERVADGFKVVQLYGGDPELLEERSPLARSEVNVRIGETIVVVNGVAATDAATLGELLRNQHDKQVLLTVLGVDGKRRDVVATAIDPARERALRYLTWERERKERVEAASQNRIGYVHLQAMGPNDIARWAREFYPVFMREGLILDLRHNGGGNIDSWIVEKLQRRAWHFWQSRRTDQATWNQQLAFRGHVVALIDAYTYSDGETMAQGLRKLGIAPLVGVTTAGAGIWLLDSNRLRDGGIARAAERGVFVDNGRTREWITEGVGVKPDVEVDNLPFATFKGVDAQLERAIKMLQDKMAKEPMVMPVVPPFPVMNK